MKDYVNVSTTKTKDMFTINGCGKFGEEKKHLSKAEACILYAKLHEWIKENVLNKEV